MTDTNFNKRFYAHEPKWIMIITGILGILVLGLGIYLNAKTKDFQQNALQTTGIVVQMKTDASGDVPLYRPVFEFTDQSGATHRAPSFERSAAYDFAMGAEVAILYDPGALAQVQVAAHDGREMAKTIMLGSLLFFVPAFLAFLLHNRRRKALKAQGGNQVFLPEDESEEAYRRGVMSRYGSLFLRKPKIMTILLGLLCALSLLGGSVWIKADARFNAAALPAQAIVTAIEATQGQNFRPTLRFTDAQGRRHDAQTQTSDPSYNYPKGTRLEVFYDPSNPAIIRIKGSAEANGVIGWAMVFFGGMLGFLALYALSIHLKFQRERARRAAAS